MAGPARLCLGPIQWAKSARAVCFRGTPPSGPRRLANPTCQPHVFAGGKPLCTRPTTTPVTLKPIPFLCCDTASRRWPNSCRRAGHPSPPSVARIPTCAPVALSHRVGYGAPWCPITAACLRLLSSPLRRSDSGADCSVMKSSSRPLRWLSWHGRKHAV
jgi:hypothetical protein